MKNQEDLKSLIRLGRKIALFFLVLLLIFGSVIYIVHSMVEVDTFFYILCVLSPFTLMIGGGLLLLILLISIIGVYLMVKYKDFTYF